MKVNTLHKRNTELILILNLVSKNERMSHHTSLMLLIAVVLAW
jgi:hypothetical protein